MNQKFNIGEEVVLTGYHENYLGIFPAGTKVKIKEIYTAYTVEDENGNLLGRLTNFDLHKE